MRIFVLSVEGKPLTPTTPCRAKKLLKDKVAKKVWSKFNTFGIQMLVTVGNKTPEGTLGVDNGTKFEGYSVVVGTENVLNIKLDLPDKSKIVKKLEERRQARRTRRSRLRRRESRFNNRNRNNFIAPSQNMLVQIRINMIENICKIYPIKFIGVEDVCFNHSKHKWGKNFSTIEIGKNKIRQFIRSIAKLYEYKGYETKELREQFGYKKISDKGKNCFESHNCDSLAIASEIAVGERVSPLENIIIVDKTYVPVRRKIHDSNYSKGGIKKDYSKGTVKGIQKGRKAGYKGIDYILSGIKSEKYRITDIVNKKKRNAVSKLDYISSQYIVI
jgi:hypothetical protein